MDGKPDPETIEALVRAAVARALGSQSGAQRPIVDAADVSAWPARTRQVLPAGAIVTPLARQLALERNITLLTADEALATAAPGVPKTGRQIVAIGADHGGYALKESLKPAISALGYAVIDCGTDSADSVDYPDFAYVVARLVSDGRAWRGVLIDGAGIGSCMAANKVPGVRAAMCYDQATASNSREHNNANVLTLGAGLIGPNLARQILETWLTTEFGGGRHGKRVEKIMAIERRFSRGDKP
jgi:ribose 5-phosphate isomerase B